MNKPVGCFEITVSQPGLVSVKDVDTDQVLLIETPFLNPYLMFTDGTFASFIMETSELTVYKQGPCYIWHNNKSLLFGKTHGDFLISGKPYSLRGKSWD
jgi:hypothetical protein